MQTELKSILMLHGFLAGRLFTESYSNLRMAQGLVRFIRPRCHNDDHNVYGTARLNFLGDTVKQQKIISFNN